MKFYVEDRKNQKKVYDILNIFFDHEEIIYDEEADLRILEDRITYGGKDITYDKRDLKKDLYDLFVNLTGYESPRGYLTGSKPSKLLKQMNLGEIKEKYRLSDRKIKLLGEVREEQGKLAFNSEDFSIYINIPFCPTRCDYCSYPTLVGANHDKGEYIDKLIYEMENIDLPRELDAIYIGGGTPSYLKANDLSRLLDAINKRFTYKEFTFEAGREDTLDRKKIEILKESGVQRISLNPQTFNTDIAKMAGRPYNLDHFLKIYEKAYDLGFIINTDFIVGLVGEDSELFKKNFEILKRLRPHNLTFHTLSIKVGSKYFERSQRSKSINPKVISQAIENFTKSQAYKPYYLYRQKNIISNLENIGYHRNDTPQRYNMIINDELENVIGLGMNANSKLMDGTKYRNARNLRDYYEKLDEEIDSKNNIINGYSRSIRRNYGN
ncbi:radical SAM protein [Anaerococcus sp. AGMB09787]|uniref:radical SAM protein n=1 Tax=Anaerococcus sp. AGMB09787 TaxID=2922869 RepID=UPI001FB00604|nr:radical SAM protein [Anaerococcus sp. AGMB09787]